MKPEHKYIKLRAYKVFAGKCMGCGEYSSNCNCKIDSDGCLMEFTPIKCPFCGIIPEVGSRILERDGKTVVPLVSHPVNECPLDTLVFRFIEWNTRHGNP